MASSAAISLARELLGRAVECDGTREDERLERNLLVAAALREVLPQEPVVVGGTAEDFWTADAYHETDLDLITRTLTEEDQSLLGDLGFVREGRHWVHDRSGVPVEIPETRLKGDLAKVHREPAGKGVALLIGPEDLYLDRIRQSTVTPEDGNLPTFKSAQAIAAANYDQMDWAYVDEAIKQEDEADPALMRKLEARARRKVIKQLASVRGRA